MALSAWQATIVNESGDVIPSAQIQVIDDATGLNADVFANSGGTPAANPFTATAGGFAQFYANAGTYRVIASDSGTGFSETWEDQRLGDAQARDTGTGADQVPTNGDLPTFGGSASGDVPTNANLSASIAGTATFSGDVYTFSPSGTGFRPLQAGMYLSFRLPSGSSNSTTTPDISYNGTTYVIKWIDGSALEANDLSETYNKQPILFYFDGTNMLIASDVSGNGWCKFSNGDYTERGFDSSTISVSTSSAYGGYLSESVPVTFSKSLVSTPALSIEIKSSVGVAANYASLTSTGFSWVIRTIATATSTTRVILYKVLGRWY